MHVVRRGGAVVQPEREIPVMAYAMAMGEAAGAAAAIAVTTGVTVRRLDSRMLRHELEHHGAVLA